MNYTKGSCTALASELSRNYRNATPFCDPGDGGGGIKPYLLSHGVLLTMCFPFSCRINTPIENHLAASWINAAIGPQVIPTETNIGLILDPALADIQCIYPTDGASDTRNNQGCGPFNFDPDSLSIFTRWNLRKLYNSYKEFNFAVTPWEDIDCEAFFGTPHSPSHPLGGWTGVVQKADQIFWTWQDQHGEDTAAIVYQKDAAFRQKVAEPVIGHAVCSLVDPEPNFDEGFFIYTGKHGMPPEKWQRAIETQQQMIATFPENDVWNEVVLGLPSHLKDIVLAVFYVDSQDMSHDRKAEIRKQAEQEAVLYGSKPLLKLDTAREKSLDEDLFVCDEDEHLGIAMDVLTNNI